MRKYRTQNGIKKAVVKDREHIGLQDINGKFFYIRHNGSIRSNRVDKTHLELTIPYRIVAVWGCECATNQEVFKHIASKLMSTDIMIRTVNLDSRDIYQEETGFENGIPDYFKIVSIDFEIKERLNLRCNNELCC